MVNAVQVKWNMTAQCSGTISQRVSSAMGFRSTQQTLHKWRCNIFGISLSWCWMRRPSTAWLRDSTTCYLKLARYGAFRDANIRLRHCLVILRLRFCLLTIVYIVEYLGYPGNWNVTVTPPLLRTSKLVGGWHCCRRQTSWYASNGMIIVSMVEMLVVVQFSQISEIIGTEEKEIMRWIVNLLWES